MYTIVGLQNPGKEYAYVRHNAGSMAVRAFCEAFQLPAFVSSAKYVAEVSEGTVGGELVRALLPTTYMNRSGSSVKKVVTDDAGLQKLIVVYDDLDLPLGTFKISHGRGSGGHNGVQSIIDALGSKEFVRVRIGISPVSLFGKMKKPTGERLATFVLQAFTKRERAKLDALLPEISKAIEMIIVRGEEKAMNTYN